MELTSRCRFQVGQPSTAQQPTSPCQVAQWAWLVALLLAALVSTACVDEPPAVPKHVLLITVDTLRADHLGIYGYPRDTSPNIDRLGEQGVVFERAVAQWPKTGPSFAAFFTGQYPHTTGLTHKAALRVNDTYLTLPELFSHAGFTTLAVVSNGVLAQRLGWNQGFDAYQQTWSLSPEKSDDPKEYRRWINARKVNELALPLLDTHRDAERLFVWLHYSDPHAPYVLPDDFENPFENDGMFEDPTPVVLENPRATALGDHRDLGHYVAAYDGNILFADQHIAAALDHADQLGILDDALVIFTADHGESLGEHDYFFGHGRLPYNHGLHVPLLVSFPEHRKGDRPGHRVAEAVELVDLYPTLRELMTPELPVPGLEGQSLMPLLDGPSINTDTGEPAGPELAFANAGGGSPLTHYRAIQDERWKLVYHPALPTKNGERPERWELFDLEADPSEANDLLAGVDLESLEGLDAQQIAELRRLRRDLLDWMDGRTWIRPPREQIEAHNEETLRALRALGYMQ